MRMEYHWFHSINCSFKMWHIGDKWGSKLFLSLHLTMWVLSARFQSVWLWTDRLQTSHAARVLTIDIKIVFISMVLTEVLYEHFWWAMVNTHITIRSNTPIWPMTGLMKKITDWFRPSLKSRAIALVSCKILWKYSQMWKELKFEN